MNTQWPDYWAGLFEGESFACLDCLRRALWRIPTVEWWYAQNIMLYVKGSLLQSSPKLAAAGAHACGRPPRLVHPLWYESVAGTLARLQDLTDVPRLPWAAAVPFAKSLGNSVRHRVRDTFRRGNARHRG